MAHELDLDDAVANVSGDRARRELEALRHQHADLRGCLAGMVEYAECNDPGNPHLGRSKAILNLVAQEGEK